MIFVYIIQGLIHGLFDTRRGGINPLLNVLALVVSVVFTVNAYGWVMIWLPFVVVMLGAVFGGIIMGFMLRLQRRSDEQRRK